MRDGFNRVNEFIFVVDVISHLKIALTVFPEPVWFSNSSLWRLGVILQEFLQLFFFFILYIAIFQQMRSFLFRSFAFFNSIRHLTLGFFFF